MPARPIGTCELAGRSFLARGRQLWGPVAVSACSGGVGARSCDCGHPARCMRAAGGMRLPIGAVFGTGGAKKMLCGALGGVDPSIVWTWGGGGGGEGAWVRLACCLRAAGRVRVRIGAVLGTAGVGGVDRPILWTGATCCPRTPHS